MPENYIEKLELTNFTAFDHIELEFAPGVNVLIGTNGTGKTHILKLLYAIWDIHLEAFKSKVNNILLTLINIFNNVFLPESRNIGNMIKQTALEADIRVEFNGMDTVFQCTIENDGISLYPGAEITSVIKGYSSKDIFNLPSIVFIPPKDILSNSPGFLALYEERNIHFSKVYKDILIKAQLPHLKKPFHEKHKEMLNELNGLLGEIELEIGGKVVNDNDAFYVKGEYGKLEFSLLAEGYSKLGLLWQLIRNGSLAPGATLFWDEPETNLNPELMKIVAKVLMVLQRHNVQVFLATHSYIMLKEIYLASERNDSVKYHKLFKEKSSIKTISSEDIYGVFPNAINDTYLDIYERDLDKD